MRLFVTGSLALCLLAVIPTRAQVLTLSDGSYAFVEHVGPGGADPCGPDAVSTFGCDEVGGNHIYPSLNGTGEYLMYSCCAGAPGPEEFIGQHAPNDFEIRFTPEGSYGAFIFDQSLGSGDGVNAIVHLPFEIWDIGPTAAGTPNDPSDDLQLIPALFADTGGTCEVEFGETLVEVDGFTYLATDRIYGYYPLLGASYDDWADFAGPLVDADPDGCPLLGATFQDAQAIFAAFADFEVARPLQRVVFLDATASGVLGELLAGSVQRFYTEGPPVSVEGGPEAMEGYALAAAYPNPFRDRAVVAFETPRPGPVRLAVYDALGREVAVLHDGPVAAGRHEVAFGAHALRSAAYLVVLTAEGGVRLTRKAVLLR